MSANSQPEREPATEHAVKLQKAMAEAGIASRRRCEDLIAAGRVSVNGSLVTQQGLRVNPDVDRIEVDGSPVPIRPGQLHLAVNKPAGMLTTMSDDAGRPCVGDLVRDRSDRLFHVGRLDADSEGLLLLTNDGELAQRMTHPSYALPKVYLAEVKGVPAKDVGRQLRAGVVFDGRPAVADRFRVIDRVGNTTLVEVTVHEGRNRIVRRMLGAVGLTVQRLVRTQVGPIRLGELRPGRSRVLNHDEVAALYRQLGKRLNV